MFQHFHGSPATIEEDPDVCEVYQDTLERFNDELMIIMIALKKASLLKCELLKVNLQKTTT